MAGWRFFIDRGGTFTDCLALAPDGSSRTVKVLSADDAPLRAMRKALGVDATAALPPCSVRMGTTIATNAVLERQGTKTVLVITRGFGDVLHIGTQARPELFALDIEKSEPLCQRVIETPMRGDHMGRVLCGEAGAGLVDQLRQARGDGFESVAIVVVYGNLVPHLELELRRLALVAGFEHVYMSHESANEQGLLKRAQTTVLDAYLGPTLRRYFSKLDDQLKGSELLVMQSSGTLAPPELIRGPQSLLSGPAGGVVACEALTRELGLASAIGFDMGGTSTDVCRVAPGDLPRAHEMTINGVTASTATLDVHTVAAGGGSICTYDLGRLQVGPTSAGAVPGPACYGRATATALTLTDVNLLLGRLVDATFPFSLDRNAAGAQAQRLLGELSAQTTGYDLTTLLAGLLRIADYTMAEAIREVSVRRGFDVRQETLIVFGGAGGQHACSVARELGLNRIVFPAHSGILSACGMACAANALQLQADGGQLLLTRDSIHTLCERFGTLRATHSAIVAGEQTQQVDLRYQGSEARVTLDFVADSAQLTATFHERHRAQFGYASPDRPIEIATLRVELILERGLDSRLWSSPSGESLERTPPSTIRMFTCDGWNDHVPVYLRERLDDTATLSGPACILDRTGCLLVEPGFVVNLRQGHLVCTDTRVAPGPSLEPSSAPSADPVTLELMSQAFMSVARQMGSTLQRTASSTNIKERLDFSCAVFDRDASLIANAPHIPVHLGAMGETVRHVAKVHAPQPGDVFFSNDPSNGGSHLPDITVVTPVFNARGELRYWVANRGHHSDIGGITPGSMPAFSATLEEEGVLLSALTLVKNGRFRDDLNSLLLAGPFPARNPAQNISDLEAQVAANHLGASALLGLESHFGPETVRGYMSHLQDYAATLTESLIQSLPATPLSFTDRLDDGPVLGVVLKREGRRLRITFDAPPEDPGNANAPRAVTVAAVLYVLRCLLGTRLPLNAGCLRPILLEVPSPSLLAPGPLRAVCSGNVETSQRVVDVLLGALGAAAASQGTMNNVTFGDRTFGYYETIAGGAGAGPSFSGASGVHTHMTNTRITDPEIVEARYPVRIRRFSLRPNSGGAGSFPGGAGCIREYEFLASLSVTLVAERRRTAPFGLGGGLPGKPGAHYLNDAPLPGRCQVEVNPGDVLRVETPGGGGYGLEGVTTSYRVS